MNIISYVSFLSFFVFPSGAAQPSAFIEESQPTRCGHTLRGVHCRGLASGLRPLRTLQRQKP